MDFRLLGRTGEKVSCLGFGCWAIGGHGYGKVEDTRSIAAVHQAFDLGVNIFDTADVYGFGHSERILAKAFGKRIKDVILATKFGVRWDEQGRTWKDCSVKYLKKAVEGSLRRLKTDCISLYQLHTHDGITPLSEVLEALIRLKSEGKILHAGISNIPANDLRCVTGTEVVASSQMQFNICFRDSLQDLIAFKDSYHMATLVYGVLARGMFTGKYDKNSAFGENDTRSRDSEFHENLDRNISIVEGLRRIAARYGKTSGQVAIRWAIDNPYVTCGLIGMKSVDQVLENVGTTEWFLEEKDKIWLEALGK